jgi:hypothetical protein
MHSTFQNNIHFSTAFTFGYMKGSDENEFCSNLIMNKLYILINSMVWVCERTIPTEQPSLDG